MDREAAQARLDRIDRFNAELAELEREGVTALDAAQRAAISAHHRQVVAHLTDHFDLDRGEQQRRMSIGMRIASIIGAVALSSAVYLFFERIWGLLPIPVQVALLVSASVAGVALTEIADRVDRSRHLLFVAAILACACVVLNVTMIGDIFAMRGSPNALLIWAAFGLALGYAYELRLPVAVGLGCVVVFLVGTLFDRLHLKWQDCLERPEAFLLPAAAVAGLGMVPSQVVGRRFTQTYRLVGLLAVLAALWGLSLVGGGYSLLPLERDTVRTLYQVAGFIAAGAAAWIGLRAGWADMTNTGAAAFVVFLYTKFFQWWWDWMPAYLFFLIIGLAAVGLILALRRVRAMLVTA